MLAKLLAMRINAVKAAAVTRSQIPRMELRLLR